MRCHYRASYLDSSNGLVQNILRGAHSQRGHLWYTYWMYYGSYWSLQGQTDLSPFAQNAIVEIV